MKPIVMGNRSQARVTSDGAKWNDPVPRPARMTPQKKTSHGARSRGSWKVARPPRSKAIPARPTPTKAKLERKLRAFGMPARRRMSAKSK